MAQKPFVLVTGGTGFLGSHIVAQLLDAGYKVRCTARSLKARFLEEAHLSRGSQFEIVEVEDLASADLEEALTGIEAVIHSAFPAPGSMESTDLLLNGVNSTTSLLRQAYERGIYKFVLTSSYLAVVGERPESVWSDHTFTDRDWSSATYDTAFETQDPARVYAAAKKLAEAAAWDFARSWPKIDLASVIPTLLVGPFAPGHAVLSTGDLSTNVLVQSLITSAAPPHPVWPHFVDVRDAAYAHIQALEAPALPLPEPVPNYLPTRAFTPLHFPSSEPGSSPFTIPDFPPPPSLSETSFLTPSASPVASSPADTEDLSPRKRLIASGTSFTWPEAIAHLREVRPDLADAGRLADETTCLPLPEHVARLDARWSGAERLEGPDAWVGINVPWRDWRVTIEDAVQGLQKVAAGLEQSGWEDFFEEDDDQDGSAGG